MIYIKKEAQNIYSLLPCISTKFKTLSHYFSYRCITLTELLKQKETVLGTVIFFFKALFFPIHHSKKLTQWRW